MIMGIEWAERLLLLDKPRKPLSKAFQFPSLDRYEWIRLQITVKKAISFYSQFHFLYFTSLIPRVPSGFESQAPAPKSHQVRKQVRISFLLFASQCQSIRSSFPLHYLIFSLFLSMYVCMLQEEERKSIQWASPFQAHFIRSPYIRAIQGILSYYTLYTIYISN